MQEHLDEVGGAAGTDLAVQDAAMTQPLGANNASATNTNTTSTPHQSQLDQGSTPAATQEQPHDSDAAVVRAATLVGALTGAPGTGRLEELAAPGTEAMDYAGQTQEVYCATMAFPVLGTAAAAAAAAATPAFLGTPGTVAAAAAPAPTPATGAVGTVAAAVGAAGTPGVAGGAVGVGFGGAAALQQQFQTRLEAALLQEQQQQQEEEGEEGEDGQDHQQQHEEEEEEQEDAVMETAGGLDGAAEAAGGQGGQVRIGRLGETGSQ